jgi:hypothetical protein
VQVIKNSIQAKKNFEDQLKLDQRQAMEDIKGHFELDLHKFRIKS